MRLASWLIPGAAWTSPAAAKRLRSVFAETILARELALGCCWSQSFARNPIAPSALFIHHPQRSYPGDSSTPSTCPTMPEHDARLHTDPRSREICSVRLNFSGSNPSTYARTLDADSCQDVAKPTFCVHKGCRARLLSRRFRRDVTSAKGQAWGWRFGQITMQMLPCAIET